MMFDLGIVDATLLAYAKKLPLWRIEFRDGGWVYIENGVMVAGTFAVSL